MTNQAKIKGRVTIGIPTRNRSKMAVRAVRSALAQSYHDVEVLLSDNRSDDDTVQRISELRDARVRVIEQAQNLGMVGNFNACLTAASGEFFLMLSDDDFLEHSAIERLVNPFLAIEEGMLTEQVGLTWCTCRIVSSDGGYLWTSAGGPLLETALEFIFGIFDGVRGPRFCGVMIRTADAIAVGGYNEQRYGPICDVGNWFQVALMYNRIACVDEPLATYTVHSSSETSQGKLGDWLKFAENMNLDLQAILERKGDVAGQRRARASGTNNITNGIVTVLMQKMAGSGRKADLLLDAYRYRRYLLTPFAMKRLLRDGWKLLRMRGDRRHGER